VLCPKVILRGLNVRSQVGRAGAGGGPPTGTIKKEAYPTRGEWTNTVVAIDCVTHPLLLAVTVVLVGV